MPVRLLSTAAKALRLLVPSKELRPHAAVVLKCAAALTRAAVLRIAVVQHRPTFSAAAVQLPAALHAVKLRRLLAHPMLAKRTTKPGLL